MYIEVLEAANVVHREIKNVLNNKGLELFAEAFFDLILKGRKIFK